MTNTKLSTRCVAAVQSMLSNNIITHDALFLLLTLLDVATLIVLPCAHVQGVKQSFVCLFFVFIGGGGNTKIASLRDLGI